MCVRNSQAFYPVACVVRARVFLVVALVGMRRVSPCRPCCVVFICAKLVGAFYPVALGSRTKNSKSKVESYYLTTVWVTRVVLSHLSGFVHLGISSALLAGTNCPKPYKNIRHDMKSAGG